MLGLVHVHVCIHVCDMVLYLENVRLGCSFGWSLTGAYPLDLLSMERMAIIALDKFGMT